jgi:hypothetical protein
MEIDRSKFISKLGGEDAAARLSSEAKADAIEEHMQEQLNHFVNATDDVDTADQGSAKRKYPTAAQVQGQIETRPLRGGVGNLFHNNGAKVRRLPQMPERPAISDFFKLRFFQTGNHVLQSAHLALENGMPDEVVLGCLLHDTSQELIRVDHGWWAAQLYEPYIPEKAAFAIRYHQALRFYPDPAFNYEYPDLYRQLFGEDYKPEPYIEATYQRVRKHKWYDAARLVTVNDLYSFKPGLVIDIAEFDDLLGRHFKQPTEGLGFDNSPVAHMWRSLIWPDRPL